MARTRTVSDAVLLDAALELMQRQGPDALTFAALAKASGLSGATLVQRFVTKAGLVHAALIHAWEILERRTAGLLATAPDTSEGAIGILTGLSGYGDAETYADGLLLLREDFRHPDLRKRGAEWGQTLTRAIGACLADETGPREDLGRMMITHWQGSLLWWAFEKGTDVETAVETSLRTFLVLCIERKA